MYTDPCDVNSRLTGGSSRSKGRLPRWRFRDHIGIVSLVAGIALFGTVVAYRIRIAERNTEKTTCAGRLLRVARALEAYEKEHGSLPPAYTVDNEGHRLHSWRSLILPYLGHQQVFEQIDFGQPWDSPRNRRYIDLRLDCYSCPSDTSNASGITNYLAVDDPHSVFRGAKKVTSRYVSTRDGSMFSVLVTEVAGSDIHWFEPRDLALADLDQAFLATGAAISSRHDKGAHVAYVSGHVTFIEDSIEPHLLKAIMTCDGREPLGIAWTCSGWRRIDIPKSDSAKTEAVHPPRTPETATSDVSPRA